LEVLILNQYEAMFLFDPALAPDYGKAKEEVERILRRAEAETVFLEKWEERKLAYEIRGRKRGLYVLAYFNSSGAKVTGIERDAQLSEMILRVLVTRADGVTREQMDKFMPHNRQVEPEHGEGEYDGGDDRRDRRRPRGDRERSAPRHEEFASVEETA
jgi:ribosomal protein S6